MAVAVVILIIIIIIVIIERYEKIGCDALRVCNVHAQHFSVFWPNGSDAMHCSRHDTHPDPKPKSSKFPVWMDASASHCSHQHHQQRLPFCLDSSPFFPVLRRRCCDLHRWCIATTRLVAERVGKNASLWFTADRDPLEHETNLLTYHG